MGTVSDFDSKVASQGNIRTEEKQHGHKEEGSKKEKALTPGSVRGIFFATSKDL
jgi:hypothetical protein